MSNEPISAKEHALKSFNVPYTISRKELYWRQVDAVSQEDAIKQIEDDYASGQIHLENTYPEYFQIDQDEIECDELNDE